MAKRTADALAPIALSPLLSVARMKTPIITPTGPPTPPLRATPPMIAAEAAWSIRLAPSSGEAVVRLIAIKEPARADRPAEITNTIASEMPRRAPAAAAT